MQQSEKESLAEREDGMKHARLSMTIWQSLVRLCEHQRLMMHSTCMFAKKGQRVAHCPDPLGTVRIPFTSKVQRERLPQRPGLHRAHEYPLAFSPVGPGLWSGSLPRLHMQHMEVASPALTFWHEMKGFDAKPSVVHAREQECDQMQTQWNW